MKTEITEEYVANWFVKSVEEFRDVEARVQLYSDAPEASAKEAQLYIKGKVSGVKRFESVKENHRRFYDLSLDLIAAGAKANYSIELLRELFPESRVLSLSSVQKELSYVERRVEELRPVLLEELCIRDEIVENARNRVKKV